MRAIAQNLLESLREKEKRGAELCLGYVGGGGLDAGYGVTITGILLPIIIRRPTLMP